MAGPLWTNGDLKVQIHSGKKIFNSSMRFHAHGAALESPCSMNRLVSFQILLVNENLLIEHVAQGVSTATHWAWNLLVDSMIFDQECT